jgi:tellurite resistance protein
MDTSFLLSTVLNGVLGARPKRYRHAHSYLTGGVGGLLSNPATLMTAAGLAWGVFETLQQAGTSASGSGTAGFPPPGATMPPASGAVSSASPVPTAPLSPVPSVSAASTTTAVPPLPETRSTAPELNASVKRMLSLAISAANADGAMNERERAAIVQQATAAGVPETALAELNRPRPLAEIVADVSTPEDAATLYVLAFTILRADERVTAVERIYLAQLAHLLRLEEPTVQALEKNVGERIEALGDQGQLGG